MTNHTSLTTEHLAEIEARANAATKGPWGFYDGDNYAEVAADMQVTSPGSCNYRERVARLEDEDYWDDQEHDGHDEERAPEQMVANAAFIAAARTDVPALLDYVRRLQDKLAAEERRHGETIDDRDHFHEMADKLAYAIAPEGVIGEHSSMNCPWENALDLITPMAEVDKLRQQLAEYEVLSPQQCPKGVHADWLIDSEYGHACPWCQIDDLKAGLADARADAIEHAAAVVDEKLTAEPDHNRASALYELLLNLRGELPCTCARSQGLHERACGKYVPGHELISRHNALAAYRAERLAAASAAGESGSTR